MINAIVIGRAAGVWEEVAALQAMAKFDATVVVNRAAVDYPGKVDHWVSYHAGLLAHWAELRRARGLPDAANYWATTYRGRRVGGEPAFPPLRRMRCDGGSSGLVGVLVALDGDGAGADRVALAGIPMDPARGHYDAAGEWKEALVYRGAWVRVAGRMAGRVRSMSGWTMEFLGGQPPTREWLLGGAEVQDAVDHH
ncbi:MAG: hypothetical protein Q7T33_14395 [Dehalococcoidia bacterium]|nr:hypothetical protein [Dehalococcoidia bacterium]